MPLFSQTSRKHVISHFCRSLTVNTTYASTSLLTFHVWKLIIITRPACLPRYLITLPPISPMNRINDSKKIIVQITPKNCHTKKSKQRKKYRTLKKAFRLINIQLWASSEWLSGATDGHSHDTFRMCERARRHEMKINLNQTWKKSFVLWHLIHGFSIMTFINVQLLLIITGVDTQRVAMGGKGGKIYR